jgi:hypothetical protein
MLDVLTYGVYVVCMNQDDMRYDIKAIILRLATVAVGAEQVLPDGTLSTSAALTLTSVASDLCALVLEADVTAMTRNRRGANDLPAALDEIKEES